MLTPPEMDAGSSSEPGGFEVGDEGGWSRGSFLPGHGDVWFCGWAEGAGISMSANGETIHIRFILTLAEQV